MVYPLCFHAGGVRRICSVSFGGKKSRRWTAGVVEKVLLQLGEDEYLQSAGIIAGQPRMRLLVRAKAITRANSDTWFGLPNLADDLAANIVDVIELV